MIGLKFTVLDARPDLHAASPTLGFRLRIEAAAPVHAILLRWQLQIEPRRRPHAPSEQERLTDVFGEAPRWKDTLKPLIWSRSSASVPAFEKQIETDLPIPCSYDFDVAASKYLDALEGGEIPLLFLFSGTVFAKRGEGFSVAQVPWDKEAPYRIPVQIWRDLMDSYFPGCAWIRLRRDSLDQLQRFRARHGLVSWDDALQVLISRGEAAAS